jgi:DNA-binding winged helix-turn-helix (wHTH) protein/predicted ATPase
MGTEPHVSSSPVRLDLTNQFVWREGVSIALTPKAFAVLRYLMERPGQLVVKEELLNAAWPGVYVGDAALKVCIRRLRQALGDVTHPPRYIETVHWRGYRFIGPLAAEETPASLHQLRHRRGLSSADAATPSATESAWTTPLPLAPEAVVEEERFSGCVGREAEFQKLRQWLSKAQQGRRQTLFLTGPAGSGKTTLVDAFLARVAADRGVPVARGQCVEQYGAGEAYLPIFEAFHRLSRASSGAHTFLSVLRRHAPTWLLQMPDLLTAAERKRLLRAVQGSSRERILREMAEAIEAFTANETLIIVMEDLHWSDYATLDFLSFLARRQEPARLLLLGVYRSEEFTQSGHPLRQIKHELQARRQCEELALAPLSLAAVKEYLAQRFPRQDFPPLLPQVLQRRTGGNPLFLSHVVDHLVDRGLLIEGPQGWRLHGVLDDVQSETPVDIQQMIEAQLERFPLRARQVLEVASVAGLEFSAATVAAGLEAGIDEVEICCEEAARRGLFLRRQGVGEWPDGTVATRYEFLHALYQETLYDRVTAGRRMQLHQRIGERGEQAYGERAQEIAAELAVHFERGRDLPRAILYRQHAAARAMRRFGYQEAIAHLTKGLALLGRQAESQERGQQEIALQNALGAASVAIHGYASPEVEHAYGRARELCASAGVTASLDLALRGLWAFYLTRAELQTAHSLAEQLRQVAQQAHNPALLLEADRELGQTLYFLGELPGARLALERGIDCYDSRTHAAHIFLYGQDPGVVCLAHNARTLCLMGLLDQARQQADEAIRLAHQVQHPFSLALAYYHAAVVHFMCRDAQRGDDLIEAACALSLEHAFPYWLSSARMLKGWALIPQGRVDEGESLFQQGRAAYQATGAELNGPYSLALLADSYGALGRTTEGLDVLGQALQRANRNTGHFYLAEIYRLQGELVAVGTNGARTEESLRRAESCLLKASDIAARQGARLLELRAVRSLYQLWRGQRKAQQARAQLASVYAQFTEGFDSLDLQEAKILLGE